MALLAFSLCFLPSCKDSPEKVLEDAADFQNDISDALEQFERGEISIDEAREVFLERYEKFHALSDRWEALSEEQGVAIDELIAEADEDGELSNETGKAAMRIREVFKRMNMRHDVPDFFKQEMTNFYNGN